METVGESSTSYSPSTSLLKRQEEGGSLNPLDEYQYCSRPLSAVSCASGRHCSTRVHRSRTYSSSSGYSSNSSSSHCSSNTAFTGASRRNSRIEAAVTLPAADTNSSAQTPGQDGDGLDESYYLRLLHYKKHHLQAEINRLEAQTETATRETQQLTALQQRKEELDNVVRCLQKDVAIINLAVSQGRLKLSRKDVTNKTQALKEANEEKRKELDQLFLSNRMRAEQLRLLEAEREAFFESIQNCTNLQPQTRSQYEQLRYRLRQRCETLNQLRAECAATCQQLSTAESRLRGDRPRQKLRLLRRQEVQQQQQLEHLDVKALPSLRLPHGEQRAGVLQVTLELKDEIRQLGAKQHRAQQEKQKHQARIVELQEALMLTNDSVAATTEEQEKLRLLAVRDTEMSTFIEQHTKYVGAELQRRAAVCAEELCIAQQQKRDLEKVLQQVPTKERLQKLEEENARRRQDLEENEKHAQRLKTQLSEAEAAQSDVQRLEKVKEREIWDVERRTGELNEEMKSIYENFEALNRSKAEERAQIDAEQETLRYALEEAVAKFDGICQKLHQLQREMQQQRELGPLEHLLEHLVKRKEVISRLKTRLETEKRKNDYEAVKGRCLQLTEDINASVRRALACQATTACGERVACTVRTRPLT